MVSSNVALIKVFLREVLGNRALLRGGVPGQTLSVEEQIYASETGGRVDGRTAAGYLFQSARISQVIQGCRQVLDLGCGTGIQLLQVAKLNPQVRFVGIDKSQAMLDRASSKAQAAGLANIRFERGEITALTDWADNRADGVMSTMTLHHLPTTNALGTCLGEIARVLVPGGALYIEDFGRLKALSSIDYFAGRDAPPEPDAFSRLYRISLQSAFQLQELRDTTISHLPDSAQVYSSFPMPFLVVIKTPDRPLSAPIREGLLVLRRALSSRQRRDLDALRKSFRLGGMGNDPFS